ncbi:MAG: EamA family transporter [Anaerolineales bacterium]|nr:EamA family transporter [Anaerolineales bacterium]
MVHAVRCRRSVALALHLRSGTARRNHPLPRPWHLPTGVVLWPLCLGIVSTGFAYLGISLVLKRIRPNTYSLVDIIVSPVVAALLGFLIFHEVPATGMICGGVLLLGSGFGLTWEMSKGAQG